MISLLTPLAALADVTSGLTAYWNLDGNLTDRAPLYSFAADTVADDAVFINEPDAGYGAGLFGQAYLGNGGAGHAAIPLSDDISGLVTGNNSVAFWFKIQAPISTWQAAIAVGEVSIVALVKAKAAGCAAVSAGWGRVTGDRGSDSDGEHSPARDLL